MAEKQIFLKDFIDEYRYYVTKYILPILGLTNNNLEECTEKTITENKGNVRSENGVTIFSAFRHDFFTLKAAVSSDNVGLAHNLVNAFTKVSQYRFDNMSKTQLKYSSGRIREVNYGYAIQKGICDWCSGTENEKLYKLFDELEIWSVKTYEGKKVTMGYIYDPLAQPLYDQKDEDKYFSWIDFIKDDYAATLTDCIHSVILLDKNCNYVDHLSITKNNIIPEYKLSYLLPYRFARLIDKEIQGTRVGVFLLNNGDIILSKHGSIKFIKRNHKWLNFSYEAFSNKIKEKLKLFNISDKLLQQVYASTLDVSLAHTGGIIAVVDNISSITSSEDNPILSPFDNILIKPCTKDLKTSIYKTKQYANINDEEYDKRILKRKAILSLVNNQTFLTVDRKLRAEFISMDGACIINPAGEFLAIGAIIQNDSGSSGGGRSAAAKKLSHHGFSIKISTDGYIELFADYKEIYKIK